MTTATTERITKYRKLPALDGSYSVEGDKQKQGRCARLTGHTLIVKGDRIECQSCGAAWKDFGF
jgi:hypothetical protein